MVVQDLGVLQHRQHFLCPAFQIIGEIRIEEVAIKVLDSLHTR